MSTGDTIARRRKELGLSQEELAERAGVSQSTIDRVERDDFKRMPSGLPAIAAVLDIDLPEFSIHKAAVQKLRESLEHPLLASRIIPGAQLVGDRDFPIYAAAQGGNGHLIVTFDAIEYVKRPSILDGVRGAYGILVVGDSMEPAYEQGDMALVHPGLPPTRNVDVVLYDHPPDGEAEAIIKRLVSWTDKEWTLKQWNPAKEWREFRVDWPTCHRVVGKYGRR